MSAGGIEIVWLNMAAGGIRLNKGEIVVIIYVYRWDKGEIAVINMSMGGIIE